MGYKMEIERSAKAAGLVVLLGLLALSSPALSQQALLVSPDNDRSVASRKAKVVARARELREAWAARKAPAPLASGNPVITEGSITTPVVVINERPAAPSIHFSFATNPSGLAQADFYFTTPLGEDLTIYWADESAPVSGSYDLLQIQQALSAWAPEGDYWLTGADILDFSGNLTTYSSPDVQSIFRNKVFRVENRHADNQLPIILNGKIRTPSISLSSQHPVLELDLKVFDQISGVRAGQFYFLGPDGQTSSLGAGRRLRPWSEGSAQSPWPQISLMRPSSLRELGRSMRSRCTLIPEIFWILQTQRKSNRSWALRRFS